MCGNLAICWEGLLANSAVFREKPCGILCMCIYMIYTRIRVYTHICVYVHIYIYIYEVGHAIEFSPSYPMQ